MKRILFLCSRNKLRSPTAEEIFAGQPGVEVDSAGLSPDADVVLSEEQVEWADLILVMESIHRKRLKERFGHLLADKRVAVLEIPDRYGFMEDALVERLRIACRSYLG